MESLVLRLNSLPLRSPATIDSIDWSMLSPSEGQRLREYGVCEGAIIEALHRGGLFGRGPIAYRVGRMTIGMRRTHAAAIEVRPSSESEAA